MKNRITFTSTRVVKLSRFTVFKLRVKGVRVFYSRARFRGCSPVRALYLATCCCDNWLCDPIFEL